MQEFIRAPYVALFINKEVEKTTIERLCIKSLANLGKNKVKVNKVVETKVISIKRKSTNMERVHLSFTKKVDLSEVTLIYHTTWQFPNSTELNYEMFQIFRYVNSNQIELFNEDLGPETQQ